MQRDFEYQYTNNMRTSARVYEGVECGPISVGVGKIIIMNVVYEDLKCGRVRVLLWVYTSNCKRLGQMHIQEDHTFVCTFQKLRLHWQYINKLYVPRYLITDLIVSKIYIYI